MNLATSAVSAFQPAAEGDGYGRGRRVVARIAFDRFDASSQIAVTCTNTKNVSQISGR